MGGGAGDRERDTHTQRKGSRMGGGRRDGKGKRKGAAVGVGGATRERKTD